MRPDARAWFEHRTTSATSLAEIDTAALLAAKRAGGHRVSVVLPARNEAATVGGLVADLVARWVDDVPLVDELVVMDSDSTDDTAAVARAAGAQVVATADVLPAHGSRPGKGEALWKSLSATTGDLVVFMDSDLLNDTAHYVPGLLTPLLTQPRVSYVKGCYTRPLTVDGQVRPAGGGRVTELTARPLLNALWPSWPASCSPSAGSTPAAARRWSRCPSSPATAWRWACWSTCCRSAACPGWPRSTSAPGCTRTRPTRRWA